MKITAVEPHHLRLPQVESKADGTQEVLIVKVTTDTGLVGYGEAVSCSTVMRAIIDAPRAAPFRLGLGVALLGLDPCDPESRWLDMYEATRWYGRRGCVLHAMSAIDTALWDITAQAAGVPCHELWGTRRQTIRAYASVLFPDSPGEAAKLSETLVGRGFSALKFGWGRFGRDAAHDREVLRAIRTAVGDEIDLMVDAGRVWDIETALSRVDELFDDFDILWLEEPLHEDDVEGYRRLAQRAPGRIAAGETEETLGHFEVLLDAGVRVVQPDIGRAGGPTVCRRISSAAAAKGAWCVPHCFGSGVNLTSSIHWAAAAEEAPFIEYPFTESPLRNDLVAGLPAMREGEVELPRGFGLGISLDESVLARFRVS